MTTQKHKHLTLSDRMDIQLGLEQRLTFKEIGQSIHKDPTTISKEVKRHQRIKDGTETCPDCPSLKKAPYVCNACPKKRMKCGYKKVFYYAKKAQKNYEQLLVEAREGTTLNQEDFWEMDKVISKGIKKGQHIYHIMATNDLNVSKSTVYRHLHKGYLSVAPIDMPRVVKFKKRQKATLPPIPKVDKEGRRYEDFLNYLKENDVNSWLEMDTVMGRTGGKVLLTFHLSFCNFIFAKLLDNKTATEVAKHIQAIKRDFNLAGKEFSETFPLILTDNGGEFARIDDIESDYHSQSQLFFCDPNRSNQKGRIEKNHTMIRDILPKGTPFDNLTQEDINLVCSHVNSVKRAALNGKTAYELFTFTYGKEEAQLLGIQEIPATEVVQSPKLIHDKL
ncbi:IS30 family transposase [Streptococcus catagoni]|uniref:IS30 family transposase n=1 Tax=Streptococcus catagoni TaxID=2654874 RepID=UPI00140E496E|nr:IS30 family transposase [Streptococcus catagoni]